tara:strand:+ start:564 stop:1946 length:1383 start_codon:yes stop_codon:yes gene_type:complete
MYKKCRECEQPTPPPKRIEINGDEYCEDCYYEKYYTCESCDEIELIEESRIVNDRYICENCISLYFSLCNECGEYVPDDSIYNTEEGNSYCEECICEVATMCYTCEDWHEHTEYIDGDAYCDGCREEKSSIIQSYFFKPNPIFFTGQNELPYNEEEHYYKNDKRLVFGFELEVENRGSMDNNQCAEILSEMMPDLLYFKRDSSIEHGFEIVSHPMTYPYFREHKKAFEMLLKKAVELGLRSYNTTTCGLHISISRKAFTESTYLKFVNFFNNKDNHSLLRTISQRLDSQLDQWCSISRFASRNGEIKLSKEKKKGANTERYQALNLQNTNVLEIRMFRGTLKADSFYKAFECIFAVYEYCSQMNFKDLDINKKNEQTLMEKTLGKRVKNDGSGLANISDCLIKRRYFNTFIHKNKKHYRYLDSFLTRKYGFIYNCDKNDSKVDELNHLLNQRKGGYYLCA